MTEALAPEATATLRALLAGSDPVSKALRVQDSRRSQQFAL